MIGCGLIAHVHAVSLRGLAAAGLVEAEVALAYDVDPRRAARFAAEFGARVASSIEEVATGSEAVYVCTSTGSHLEAAAAAARAGRPIFCEKPLARSFEESVSLARLVVEAGVPVQVGLVLRSAPVFRRLAELSRSGRFGRPMAAVVRDDQYFPIQGHYASTWRGEAAVAGSGVLLEHSIHDVDIIQACFGPVARASAHLRMFGGHEGIEDSVSALLRTESGLSVSLATVWHNVLSRPSTRRFEVLFEDAVVSLDDDFTGPLRVQTSAGAELWDCPPPPWVSEVPLLPSVIAARPYLEENRQFVESVIGRGHPAPGLEEALSAHAVVDACYRSAAAGGAPTEPPR